MTINFGVYFTDHLGKTKKINDNIIDIADGLVDVEVNRLYAVASFITNGVYYDPTIIGDGVERVEIRWQIDDKEIKSHKFVIDGLDFLEDNNIRIYLKTKGILFSYKYSGLIDYTAGFLSLKEILSDILDGLELDFDNFTDRELPSYYKSERKSKEEIIEELSSIFGFEYYYNEGKIVFSDNENLTIKFENIPSDKYINVYDYLLKTVEYGESAGKFNEDVILNFSTSIDTDIKISKIILNETKDVILQNGSVDEVLGLNDDPIGNIIFEINPSPQPAAPSENLNYTNGSNTYTIAKKGAVYKCFFAKKEALINARITADKIDAEYESKEDTLIEKWTLNKEKIIKLKSFVKNIIDIKFSPSFSGYYKTKDNTIALSEEYDGTVTISYNTEYLIGEIPPISEEMTIKFKIEALGEEKEYEHKIVLDGYYPLPYDLTISLCSDMGFGYSEALYKDVFIYKYNTDTGYFNSNVYASYQSNGVGEFVFHITEYGLYKIVCENHILYLAYFVNKKEKCLEIT